MEAPEDYEVLLWDMPTDELRRLLDAGLPVNVPDGYGDYLLTVASARLQEESVNLLLARGANPDCRNTVTDTPLLCAIDVVEHNPPISRAIVKSLLAAGANIELRGYMDKTPFLKACSRCDLDMLRLLVASGCDTKAVVIDLGVSLDGEQFASIFKASVEFREYLHGLRRA